MGSTPTSGTIVLQVDSRQEAELIIASQLREDSRIVQLRRRKPEEIRAMVKQLGARRSA